MNSNEEHLPVQIGTRRIIMQKYSEMTREQLLVLKKELEQQYADIKAQGLALDMSRGKPAADQLDLSMEMMDAYNFQEKFCRFKVFWLDKYFSQ